MYHGRKVSSIESLQIVNASIHLVGGKTDASLPIYSVRILMSCSQHGFEIEPVSNSLLQLCCSDVALLFSVENTLRAPTNSLNT